jgi:hypothetical protein
MSPTRLIVAAIVSLALAGLLGWQASRMRRVEACTADGKIWHGPTSKCVTPRPGPILERDLRRS